MPAASYQSGSGRRRAIGLAMAVAAHLLVLILMLTLAPKPEPRDDSQAPTAFTMFDVPKPVPTPGAKVVKVTKAKASTSGAAGHAPVPRPPSAPPTPPTPPSPLLIGGHELFEAADISKLAQRGGGDSGSATGRDSGSVYGPGEGPGGQRLYNAEWEREPTRAEMITYLAEVKAVTGAGLIACKTIPGNRVDNCRSLGDVPLGSGISRAMRLAAWQFHVRPPRIDGRPVIGAWVRIRFDLTVGVAH